MCIIVMHRCTPFVTVTTHVPTLCTFSVTLAQVFRLKVAQIVSLKAYPAPCLKIAKLFPLPNTGMGVKLHYEVPLAELHHFYRPPARLMVR